MRVERFLGGDEQFIDWSFDMKMAVGSRSRRGRRAMEKVELGEMTILDLIEADPDGHAENEYIDLDNFSEEFF